MEAAKRIETVKALLAARDQYVAAQVAQADAKRLYVEAEKAYLDGFGTEPVENLIVGDALVMPKPDWYDDKPGERLSFHKVQTVQVTS